MEANTNSSKPNIRCTFFSSQVASKQEKAKLIRTVEKALGVKEDINNFYAVAAKDTILQETVKDLHGMRTVVWPELFPALILAVTLQMAPMKRSNQMMDLLIENFGDRVTFDGKTIAHWPSTKRLAKLDLGELREKAKLGYRAKNLISIAKTLQAGFPTFDELSRMPREEAKKKLMTLRGIGDYSAEIVIPGMGFPLDVWSAKIFGILLLGKEPQTPREAIPELKRIAEQRWGKWLGHTFVYVLNDLPALSKKLGVDLTHF